MSLAGGARREDLLERIRLVVAARPRPARSAVVLVVSAALLAMPTVFVVAPWVDSL